MKRVATVILLALLVLSVAGCGAKDPIVGKWNGIQIFYGDRFVLSDSDTYVNIKPNGTATLQLQKGNVFTGTWHLVEEFEENATYTIIWDGGGSTPVVVPYEPEKTEYGTVYVILVFDEAIYEFGK